MTAISIVILHYNNFALTKECINNMLAKNWAQINYKFIVVDNCSPDKSGQKLFEEYEDEELVTVLLLDKNLGFSKGNNEGIRYGFYKQRADLVVVSNNDIKIEDNDFFQKLVELYKNETFAVLGPDIYSEPKKIHQSPLRNKHITVSELEMNIKRMKLRLVELRIIKFMGIYELLRKFKKVFQSKVNKEAAMEKREDVVIHGAFFVLSSAYISQYPRGLFEGVFMYMEEDILAYFCAKKNLKMLFDPALKVLHYDGLSTRSIYNKRVNKYIFELNNTIKSANVLLSLMQKED